MASVGQILLKLEEMAPTALKMDFDNVGLLVGDKNKSVNKCLIALDITDDVIKEASDIGAHNFRRHKKRDGG